MSNFDGNGSDTRFQSAGGHGVFTTESEEAVA